MQDTNSSHLTSISGEGSQAALRRLIDAADALLSNEEHAVSAGIHGYQKGSPTWHLWNDLRVATNGAAWAVRKESL